MNYGPSLYRCSSYNYRQNEDRVRVEHESNAKEILKKSALDDAVSHGSDLAACSGAL